MKPGLPGRDAAPENTVAENSLLVASFYYRGIFSARDLVPNGVKMETRMKNFSKVCEKALQ